jgi:hypothetical protein
MLWIQKDIEAEQVLVQSSDLNGSSTETAKPVDISSVSVR